MLQDIRYALRMLLKAPGFTAVAVLALALGIGATSAVFSVVNAVLLHPLGAVNSDRLVIVYAKDPRGNTSYPGWADFFDWKDQARSFEQLVAWRGRFYRLAGADRPARLYTHRVSEGFFDVLGLKPILGRIFGPEEKAAILTHKLWQGRFGGDPKVIGQTLNLNDQAYTIVGVMPDRDFQLHVTNRPELWIPLQLSPQERRNRRSEFLGALARLKPGVPLEKAQAEMDVIARRVEQEHPDTNRGFGARVVFAADDLVSDIRPTFLVLLGAVACVLLIACANVANLLLARAAGRRREIAIRTAMGAGRLRVVRQLLTESALLGLIGGGLGLALAAWSIDPLLTLIPTNVPYVGMGNIRVDGWVLGFTLAVALLTGVLFGLTPAFEASKTDLTESLKEGGRGSTGGVQGRRFRGLLVVSEVVLALVLLVSAGLMVRSFVLLQKVNPGFRPDHLLALAVQFTGGQNAPDKSRAYFAELVRRLEVLPGVRSASIVGRLPLGQWQSWSPIVIEGRPAPPAGQEPRVEADLASPNYFQTMGIPLVSGRALAESDGPEGLPVVVISATMARRFWPDEDPIGKRIQILAARKWFTIVGVVADVKQESLAADPLPYVYIPHTQTPFSASYIVMRTALDPSALATAAQREIWTLGRDQMIHEVRTMDQVVSDSVWQLRYSMTLLGAFAGVALLLAAAGIYGVMSYAVSQRRHEIGIRMALGARQTDVLRLVMGQGLKLAVAGVAIGLPATLALVRLLSRWLYGLGGTGQEMNQWLPTEQRGLLYGISASDPVTFVAISLLLSGVALAASYVPARRAMRVDPIAALRHE